MRVFLTGASGFIGTHLIERLLELYPGVEIQNADLVAPKLRTHDRYWVQGDVMNKEFLVSRIKEFQPTHVVHMAARTDPDGVSAAEYSLNTQGSANVIEAIKQAGAVHHSVFFSTQYVVKPGPLPTTDTEYRPVNAYGESKSMMEDLIRADAGIPGIWTIVRPTNVWGPWHPRYAEEVWLVIKKGRYIHPGGKPVVRAYGYVGNVVEYVCRIIAAPREVVDRKTFYVGDPTADIKNWVSAFSKELTGRKPRIAPRPVLRSIALVGDVVKLTGKKFPLFTSRYRSMTQDYLVNMEPTFAALGPPLFSVDQGVKITVEWLRTQGKIWE